MKGGRLEGLTIVSEKKAAEYLYRVLREMEFQPSQMKRHQLRRLGESLLGERKDVEPKHVETVLRENGTD